MTGLRRLERKEQSFTDVASNGCNRLEARLPEVGPCTGGARQKVAVGAKGRMRRSDRS